MRSKKKMKLFLFVTIAISLIIACPVLAAWEYNPFTDELDYHSGVSIPQPYQASPTLETLRDALIAAGIMSPAPTLREGEIVWQDRDNQNIVFQDRNDDATKIVFQDYSWSTE